MTEPEPFPALETIFEGFRIRNTEAGFMDVPDLLAFLDYLPEDDAPAPGLFSRGWILGIIAILIGGFLLNLTPCVLPMIPINLAIIGAGAKADTRRRGFFLGGAYGASMALVYGMLGLVVVLTGATFGTLNASPIFNAVIALLFVVLALGMFDLLPIDLSHFQHRLGAGKTGNRYILALGMGAVAALLAGACVAPVLISVLLLSADLYGRGLFFGLGLPFLLGVGMGLPWPFAGAGLSFLPPPGRWMTWVKYAFGFLILVMALYYGRLAWKLAAPPEMPVTVETGYEEKAFRLSAANSSADWASVLDQARANRTPVLIDFWATWCRVCLVMERTTFRDEAVLERLKGFTFIKYQAEQPHVSPTREIMEHFSIVGLPTLVILDPK